MPLVAADFGQDATMDLVGFIHGHRLFVGNQEATYDADVLWGSGVTLVVDARGAAPAYNETLWRFMWACASLTRTFARACDKGLTQMRRAGLCSHFCCGIRSV